MDGTRLSVSQLPSNQLHLSVTLNVSELLVTTSIFPKVSQRRDNYEISHK